MGTAGDFDPGALLELKTRELAQCRVKSADSN